MRNAPLNDQVPHHAAQELTIGDRGERRLRRETQYLRDEFAIGSEVILPAEHAIVYASDVRLADVDVRVPAVPERIACGH